MFENQINRPIDIIVHYGTKEQPFAEKFFSLCSILNNESDAAEFNKSIRANKYDPNISKCNEPQFSSRQYELYIGWDKNMGGLDECFNSFGLHVDITGRKACIYVDSTHTDKKEYSEFLKFAKGYEQQMKNRLESKSEQGLVAYSASTITAINASLDSDGFLDVPKFFKTIGHGISRGFKWVARKLGFGYQKAIHKEKFMFLVKFFYICYFPSFVNTK